MPPELNEEQNTKIDFRSQAFKKYFANTSWLFAERIVRMLVTFFTSIYIVRYLGPSNFGLLSYAISFVGLFASISALGLESIVVRELLKKPDDKDLILGTSFFLRLAGGGVSVIVISFLSFFTEKESFTRLLIIIVGLSSVFQAFSVIDFYFRAKVFSKYSVLVQFYSFIICSIAKLIFIIYDASIIYFAAIVTIESLLQGIGFVLMYKKNKDYISFWRFNKNTCISLLKDSWPLVLSGIAVSLYMKIDQVMIKNMLDDKNLGYYAAAVRLCEAWYFIPIAIVNSLAPAIINAKNASRAIYMDRLQKLYDLLTAIAIFIAVPVTIFSGLIVRMLLGAEYLPSASVLTLYIWAGISVSLGLATEQYLVIENHTRLSFYRTFMGMIINIALNFVLIPLWGINGATIATLISYSVVAFTAGFSRKTSEQTLMLLKSLFLINIFSALYYRFKNTTA